MDLYREYKKKIGTQYGTTRYEITCWKTSTLVILVGIIYLVLTFPFMSFPVLPALNWHSDLNSKS